MISCLIHNNVSQDGPTQLENQFQTLTFMRKLDAKPMPFDFERQQRSRRNLSYFTSERQMIEAFISKVTMVDPDLLIAHNLCGGLFELLLSRIQYLKVNHWSRIGRMKKTSIPNKKFDSAGGGYGGS
jgi:DNA polymerase alpha subunit A